MSEMTTKEKARMYDELVKLATYNNPSYGYHNGGWEIHISPWNHGKDCPKNFRIALEMLLLEKDQP